MLPTNIYHYSPRESIELKDSYYESFRQSISEEGSMKPCGLWLSIEDDETDMNWFDWCKIEQFRLECLRFKFIVHIKEDAKILWLRSSEEVVEFTRTYISTHPLGLSKFLEASSGVRSSYYIDWKRVKNIYDGIIISPYQWELRLSSDSSWYYTWDFASGCIWNLEKVSLKLESVIDIELLKEVNHQ